MKREASYQALILRLLFQIVINTSSCILSSRDICELRNDVGDEIKKLKEGVSEE